MWITAKIRWISGFKAKSYPHYLKIAQYYWIFETFPNTRKMMEKIEKKLFLPNLLDLICPFILKYLNKIPTDEREPEHKYQYKEDIVTI